MLYDNAKLSGRIREKYGTQREFAKAIGLSERSVSLKLNGLLDWRQSEIYTACNLLDIDVADVHLYFLAAKIRD